MKKPLKEEMPAFLCVRNFKSIFLFFFIFNQFVFSQVPINGFCKYDYHPIPAGYASFFPLNFNNDEFTDFILFNHPNSFIQPVKGVLNDFHTEQRYSLSRNFSSLYSLTNNIGKVEGFAFVSRVERVVGLINFNNRGRVSISNEIKFNSFPDGISSADINLNGKIELLVFGAAFEGLSILYPNGNKIKEVKIVNGDSYSNALFVDINSDSYPDIAAYNLISNQLEIFHNNSRGEFKLVRTMDFPFGLQNLKTFDFNLDGYPDLIFTSQNSINILFGMSNGDFSPPVKIITDYNILKIIYGDFNKNGKIDLAYLTRQKNKVQYLLQKEEGIYYPEITGIEGEDINDILSYYSKYTVGLIALSSKGSLHTLSNYSAVGNEISIKAGANPGKIFTFDAGNDALLDFGYVNIESNRLILLVRNKSGVPEIRHSIKMNNNADKIKILSIDENKKYFLIIDKNSKALEIISVNFFNYENNREYLYTDGNINDVYISKSKKSDIISIYIASLNRNSLFISEFQLSDSKFKKITSKNINKEIVETAFDNKGNLFVWKSEVNNLKLLYYSNEFKNADTLLVKEGKSNKVKFSFVSDIFNTKEDVLFSSIEIDSIPMFVAASKNYFKIIEHKGFNIGELKYEDFYWGEFGKNALQKIFIYVKKLNSFFTFDIIKKSDVLLITQLKKLNDPISSFVVERINPSQYYLLFTNPVNKCIVIKRL